MRNAIPAVIAMVVLAVLPVAGTAEEALPGSPAAPFPTGVLVEGIVTQADPEKTYTLFLPEGYPGGEEAAPARWPALLVFDPRGRSRAAAELFVEGARRHGWIVLSSDGTRSDGPWEPNARALKALVPELDTRFSVDPRRVYAAGFSGGAHVGWILGRSGVLAGVIASGGREAPEWMIDDIPFASYGAAGTTDFNFAGMHAVDAHFGSRGAPHRLEIFEGTHQWMPPELATEAVGWMEVVAMVQGRRPVDRTLAVELYQADLARAEALEAAGELLRAAERYRAILRTYEALALPELAAPAARLAAVEASPAYAAARRERERWDGYEAAYGSRLGTALLDLGSPQQPVSAERLARRLEIDRLLRLAGEEAASAAQRHTAGRLLGSVFAQTAFYLHRDLRAAGQDRQAVAVLEVAERIRPDDPILLYNLACARAQAGREKAAMESLQAALAAGFPASERLRSDPDLDPLRDREDFRLLLPAVEEAPPPPPPPPGS